MQPRIILDTFIPDDPRRTTKQFVSWDHRSSWEPTEGHICTWKGHRGRREAWRKWPVRLWILSLSSRDVNRDMLEAALVGRRAWQRGCCRQILADGRCDAFAPHPHLNDAPASGSVSRHVLLFRSCPGSQRSQDNKEGGPDTIRLHPTQSGASDDRDDLNTVE